MQLCKSKRNILFILFPVLLRHTQKDLGLLAQVQSCHFLQQVKNPKGVVEEVKFRILFPNYFITTRSAGHSAKVEVILRWLLLSSHWDFENLQINWIHYCVEL